MFCAFWALDMAPTLDVLVLFIPGIRRNQIIFVFCSSIGNFFSWTIQWLYYSKILNYGNGFPELEWNKYSKFPIDSNW